MHPAKRVNALIINEESGRCFGAVNIYLGEIQMDYQPKLSASLEDYLEAIYEIELKNRFVRVKDIANKLSVNSPSVTGALISLKQKKLVNYEPYQFVTLTEAGKVIASEVLHRHTVLRDFFIKVLRVDYKESNDAACRMEHVVSKNILERLIKFIEFIERCPLAGAEWVDGFGYYCEAGSQACCEHCLDESGKTEQEQTEDKP